MAIIVKPLFMRYNPPADLTYGKIGDQFTLQGFIQTSGSTTTTTATNGTPFAYTAAGYVLQVFNDNDGLATYTKRRIDTNTSGTSVVVDAAWNITSRAATAYPFYGGTAATDGWFGISHNPERPVYIRLNISTLAATQLRMVVQARLQGGTGTTVSDTTYAATGAYLIPIDPAYPELRVGLEETAGSGTDIVDVDICFSDDNVAN